MKEVKVCKNNSKSDGTRQGERPTCHNLGPQTTNSSGAFYC